MATETPTTPKVDSLNDRLDPAVLRLLGDARARIRRYVSIQAVALLLVAVTVAFWASLAVDWLFEPPAAIRAALLAIYCALCAYVVFRMLIRRLSVSLDERRMALLLERRFTRFGDTLLTSVELAIEPEHAEDFDPTMVAATGEMARRRAGTVDLDELFNAEPLKRSVVAATVLVLSVIGFALLQPATFGIWARRALALSPELWPRYTRLEVAGFEDGVAKVARGGDFDLLVKADTTMIVPRVVQVRYRTDDGARQRVNMGREGNAVDSGDPFQSYTHRFERILSPYTFDVVGRDARVEDLRIEVVDSPTITEMTVDCRFPEYLDRSPRVLPVTGVMMLPFGTEATLYARTNKDLVRAVVEPGSEADSAQSDRIELTPSSDNARYFSLDLGTITGDRALLLTLVDQDGIRSRDPVRLVLVAVADESPEVDVRTKGIGPAITPLARVPFEGQMSDDHGITRNWYEYNVDEQEPDIRDLSVGPASRTELEVDEAFEAGDLDLKPGSKLMLVVKAEDSYALADEPNTGTSQRFVLDIVTPETLLAMLESRELNLRRRFETIIAELTESRDSLARLDQDLVPNDAPDAQAPNEDDRVQGGEQEPSPTAVEDPASADASERTTAEPAQPTSSREEEAARAEALARLRVERALQNARKNGSETLGLGESFTEIHEELVNNRVDTEELKTRLRDGIAEPLTRLAEEMFPEYAKRLETLEDHLSDPQAATTALASAEQQADQILVTMQQILDRMKELESFNEVIDLLRTIIDSQDEMHRRTQDRRRQSLRELLEEP